MISWPQSRHWPPMTPTPPDPGAPVPAWLTAGSRREAMDWGLVLISQGIPAVIERVDPEEPPIPPAPSGPLRARRGSGD